MPFMLTARAQGELAQVSGARAVFAEGLASSYEAFHHTRKKRGTAKGGAVKRSARSSESEGAGITSPVVPTAWYERQVTQLIPSRSSEPAELLRRRQIRIRDLPARRQQIETPKPEPQEIPEVDRRSFCKLGRDDLCDHEARETAQAW